MYMPDIFGGNLFDSWLDDLGWTYRTAPAVPEKTTEKRVDRLMKTDVRETENAYEVEIDLPGYKKEEVSARLEKGYLTIKAEKHEEQEEDKKGRYLRRERYTGSISRTFFVGSEVTQKDIRARFEDGVLNITVNKIEQPRIPENKYVSIE